MQLPVDAEHVHHWSALGIQWLNSKKEPSLLASAILPEGWLSKDFPGQFSHMHCFELYDEEGIPRATVLTRNAAETQWANVFLRTKEQGKKILWVNKFTDDNGNCPDFSEAGVLQLMASKRRIF